MFKKLKNAYMLALEFAKRRFIPTDALNNPLAQAGSESQNVTECKKSKETQKHLRSFKKQQKRMEAVAMVAHRGGCDILKCKRKACFDYGNQYRIISKTRVRRNAEGKLVEVIESDSV